MSRMISLDRFVRDVLSSIGDDQADGYIRMLRIALRVIPEFKEYIDVRIKSDIYEVESSMTVTMPEDCIEPLFAGRYHKKTNALGATDEYVWPFAKKERGDMQSRLSFIERSRLDARVIPDTENFVPDSHLDIYLYNFGGGSNQHHFKWPSYYFGENYDLTESTVYGFWSYDEYENRLVLDRSSAINPGDYVAVQFQSSHQDYSAVIPEHAYSMYRARCLQVHNEGIGNLNMARHFRLELKAEISMFKRKKLDKLTLGDYIDAFRRGTINAV